MEIPLSYVNEGENTFELTTDGQKCYDFGWGQFIIYGVTFRIFYDESKNHPTGIITAPTYGTTIGENPVITVAAESSDGIKRIDFIGFYEDFNYQGDNIWRQWQFALYNGLPRHHLGTVYNEPYSITWNTEWVPDQDKPMKIMARIVDDKGMQYITSAVEDIRFTREDRSVKLYKPYNIPMNWATRVFKTHTCKVLVSEDLDYAVDARMILVSWSGIYAERIGINGEKVVTNTGRLYDRSYNEIPVPVDLIRSGVNTLFTYSSTSEHGIEVNWPGIVLKVVYEGTVGVDENRLNEELIIKPAEYALFQNTPNPFNPITTIEYMLPRETHVNLTIFNMSGQQVAVLKKGVEKEGRYTVTFDAADLPSGLYFYRLESGEFIATKKMLLIK